MGSYTKYINKYTVEDYTSTAKATRLNPYAYTPQENREENCEIDAKKKELEWLNLLKTTALIRQKRNSILLEKFIKFSAQWREETMGHSASHRITRNPAYLNIIGLGPEALPFIFKELEKKTEYWFDALEYIAQPDKDPIANEHYGDIEKMRQDWLKWGRENNKF